MNTIEGDTEDDSDELKEIMKSREAGFMENLFDFDGNEFIGFKMNEEISISETVCDWDPQAFL